MTNIKDKINKKVLKDLTYTKNIGSGVNEGSNLIEPDDKMIDAVVALLRDRTSYHDIKATVKKQGTKLSLSLGQIKEIHKAMDDRIADLSPAPAEIG